MRSYFSKNCAMLWLAMVYKRKIYLPFLKNRWFSKKYAIYTKSEKIFLRQNAVVTLIPDKLFSSLLKMQTAGPLILVPAFVIHLFLEEIWIVMSLNFYWISVLALLPHSLFYLHILPPWNIQSFSLKVLITW